MAGMTQEPITISGAPHGRYKKIVRQYDYDRTPLDCPNCGKAPRGFIWKGWYSCDECNCIALVGPQGKGGGYGRAFIPYNENPGAAAHMANEFIEQGAGI